MSLDSQSAFIRRQKALTGPTHPSPVTPTPASFFTPPSSYPPQVTFASGTGYNLRGPERNVQKGNFFPPATAPSSRLNTSHGQRRPQTTSRLSDMPSLSPATRYESHYQTNQFQPTNFPHAYPGPYPGQPPRTAGSNARTQPFRQQLDPLSSSSTRGRSASASMASGSGRLYPSPPATAPHGPRPPSQPSPQFSPTLGLADDAARARATLIDRERRQIFSFLSSPNCFLFSGVTGPVGLTEEDLDLLLAAGTTSSWTLLHLRALDAAGKRFQGFDQLIPAVAGLANKQIEENRKILNWLTSSACTLFGSNDEQNGHPGVLLSMADVERLVLESQSGLEALKQLQQNGASFDTFQQLIHAVRELELSNQSGGASSPSRHRKGKSETNTTQTNAAGAASNATSGAVVPFNGGDATDIDSEERRLVLDYVSSSDCTLFSNADAVIATATDLDSLIHACGNAALAIEALMQFDQNQVKFMAFNEILPALQALKASGGKTPGTLRPLLTQSQIEENRQIAHAYLSSPECQLFSEKEEPVSATGRDFDELVFAAGGDAHECVNILKQLDAGTAPVDSSTGATPGSGMKFQSFPQLIQSVALVRAANLAHEQSLQAASQWTPELRERVLSWLASDACTLFSELTSGDVEVHLRELDILMDIGGSHTLQWLQFFQQHIPIKRFQNFAALTEAIRQASEEMKTQTIPKLLTLLSKSNCPLWQAPNDATSANASKSSNKRESKSKKSKSSKGAISSGPGSGSMIAAKVTSAFIEDLVFQSEACSDTGIHLDMLIREGRAFSSLPSLITAVKEAHEDRRNLAFVSDTDRAAIVEFLSKENCVLFVENEPSNATGASTGSNNSNLFTSTSYDPTNNSSPPNQDIHVRKQDLDRLIVEGKGVNMCLFHLSALNASGKQFHSFLDLIPAVREQHQRSVELKLELWQKLQTHRLSLFPAAAQTQQQQYYAMRQQQQLQQEAKEQYQAPPVSDVMHEITQAQSDSLFIDGTAGGQTIHYIDIFLETNLTFVTFAELIAAVKDLHSQVLRNKYANYLMERSEKSLAPQEKRNVILAYLYSHDCTLFSEAEDVNVSDEDLDLLQMEAAGGSNGGVTNFSSTGTSTIPSSSTTTVLAHTLLFLKYIDWSGRKFQSFTPLKAAVRDCYLASLRQKKAILDYLRNAGESNKTNSNQGNSGAGCRLLSTTAAQLQRTLDVRDIERLFIQGTAGPTTMSYLLDLEDQHLQFTSLDSIIHAVRLAHTQAIETRSVEKNILFNYLGSGSCTLLSSNNNGVSSGVSTASTSVPLKAISDMELVTLLNVGKGGVSTLFFLQLLESSGRTFTSFSDLIQSVKEVKDGHSAQRKKEIAAFLKSDRCNLLRDIDRTPVNQACIDRIYVESGAASSTLIHLWYLNVSGHSFASLDSLIASIKLSYETSFTRGGSERGMLFVHLFGPPSTTLPGGNSFVTSTSYRVFPDLHHLAPVFWLKIHPESDLDAAIQLCESGANCMRFLIQLARSKKMFQSWTELLDGLHGHYQEMLNGRQALLARLQNSDECTLFQTASGQSTVDVSSLTLHDMDALILRTQDARKTLFLLEAFEHRRSRFSSFADLVAAIGVAHWNTMASIRTEKSLIYLHLTAPSCTLLANSTNLSKTASVASTPGSTQPPPPVQILDPELDALFLIAGSAKGTLFYLNQLEAHHKSYETMTQLIEDVHKLHAESLKVKAEVLNFFQHPSQKLLQPTTTSNHGLVSPADIDRLYTESGAGVELLPLLHSLQQSGLRFVSMTQVVAAVRSAALRSTQQQKEDRLLILSFLSRPDCKLFRGPVAAKPKDIDSLILAGGGPIGTSVPGLPQPAAATLELLKEIESQSTITPQPSPTTGASVPIQPGVDSFTGLIEQVTALRQQGLQQRSTVLAFLTSPRCFLFKDAPNEVVIDAAAVEKLFLRSQAGKHTLDHIRSLSIAGGRFGSFFNFDELIEAVRALHLQSISTAANEVRKDEEESKEETPSLKNSAKPGSAVILPLPARPLPPTTKVTTDSLLSPPLAGSPAAVLAYLQSPHRRFFRLASDPILLGERELDALLSVSESPATCLKHLQELEIGASAYFGSFNDLLNAIQTAEHRALTEKKALVSFLSSNKFRVMRQRKGPGRSPSPSPRSPGPNSSSAEEPEPAVHITESQVDELLARGGAGSLTIMHLQRLNESTSHAYAPDFNALIDLVREAHLASIDTLRSQKQMIRTYLSSFHSDLLWSGAIHTGEDATAAPFRHRLSDMDLNHLLSEAGGSGASLMRHLHKLDETRLSAAANHHVTNSAGPSTSMSPGQNHSQRKSYHTIGDLIHAVRDLNHHELHTKRELLDSLNSRSCTLWSESTHTDGADSQQHHSSTRVTIHDVDRLFDGTNAHFDTPLILWLFIHSGRTFQSSSQLIEAVREARLEYATGANAEVLSLIAHFSSSLCMILPQPSNRSSVTTPFRVTLGDLIQLINIGGGGSGTLFQLFQLESRGFVARDWNELVHVVGTAANGVTMQVKIDILAYLSEQARIFTHDSERLEAIFGSNDQTILALMATDSLAQLPATSAGVSRMIEEGGCGLNTIITLLKSFDRTHRVLPDLRSLVDELLDQHSTRGRYEESIITRRAKIAADKAMHAQARSSQGGSIKYHATEGNGADVTSKRSSGTGVTSSWSDSDRHHIFEFLSHPDTLLFSEIPTQHVTPQLLDELLTATTSSNGDDHSPQEALVLLHHLNIESKKMADVPELIQVLTKEHSMLNQLATEIHSRLLDPKCTLWQSGKSPSASNVTVADVKKQILLDTHCGLQTSARLDELELSQFQFNSISQLSAALSDGQQAFFSRLTHSKEHLIQHLSQPAVASQLFSQQVNMNDVDLYSILLAGRFGGVNCTEAIDAAIKLHRKFDSVSALLTAIRSTTAEHEQEFLSYLHTPAGSSLLAQPAHVLSYLSGHLLTCMSFIYGSVDGGPSTISRARTLAVAQMTFTNVHKLIDGLRQPEATIQQVKNKRASLQRDASTWAKQAGLNQSPAPAANTTSNAASPSTSAPVIGPLQEDIDSLVAFLRLPTTLLFDDSAASEALSIETEQIASLFRASTNNQSAGSWDSLEPHLRAMNLVHRRFTRFNDLAAAVMAAQSPEANGAYASQEQVDTVRNTIQKAERLFAKKNPLDSPQSQSVGDSRMKEAGSLTYDSNGHLIVSHRQVDRLLRTIPVNPDSASNGFVELCDHLKSFSSVGRQFKDWLGLQSALAAVVANPDLGHLSEAEVRAIRTFFEGADCEVLAVGVPPPTGPELDEMVLAGLNLENMMELLSKLNERKMRIGTVRALIDEIGKLRATTLPILQISSSPVPSPLLTPSTAPPTMSRPPSVPLIPHISDDDSNKLATFLGQSMLFAHATAAVEITVESLDALAFECGSVPDLLDLLKRLDKSGENFQSFSDLHLRVKQLLHQVASTGPVGDEPKPMERRPSQLTRSNPSTPLAQPATSQTAMPVPPIAHITTTPTIPEQSPVVVTHTETTVASSSFTTNAAAVPVTTAVATVVTEPTPAPAATPAVTTTIAPAEPHLPTTVATHVEPTVTSTPASEVASAPTPTPASVPPVATPQAESSSTSAAAPAPTSAPIPVAAVPALTDDERQTFVDWLQSCNFFANSDNLSVTVEELDSIAHAGGGLKSTLVTLNHMNNNGMQFKDLTEILPALKQELAHPTPAKPQPTATVPTQPMVDVAPVASSAPVPVASDPIPPQQATAPTASTAIISMTDDERADVVAVLTDGNLFSETTEELTIDPVDLDILRTDAGSAARLVDGLKAVDARGSRPKTFHELFTMMKEYFQAASNTSPATTSNTAQIPTQPPSTVIGPNDAGELVGYLGSEECLLFSEAADNLSVEPHELDQLLVVGGGLASLLSILKGMDHCYRRFNLFQELKPAVQEVLETNSHIGQAASSELVNYLSGDSCALFSESNGLEVTVDELDGLIAAGHGLQSTLTILNMLNALGKKFMKFSELAPAVAAYQKTN